LYCGSEEQVCTSPCGDAASLQLVGATVKTNGQVACIKKHIEFTSQRSVPD
jgi:hypothetical protein